MPGGALGRVHEHPPGPEFVQPQGAAVGTRRGRRGCRHAIHGDPGGVRMAMRGHAAVGADHGEPCARLTAQGRKLSGPRSLIETATAVTPASISASNCVDRGFPPFGEVIPAADGGGRERRDRRLPMAAVPAR